MTIDPLSQLITQIRNAQAVGKKETVSPYSKLKEAILLILKKRNYIANYKIICEDNKKNISVSLKYNGKQPAILALKQISKQGRRKYVSCVRIPRPAGGFGLVILSTSKGVLASDEAKKIGVGGEVLFEGS